MSGIEDVVEFGVNAFLLAVFGYILFLTVQSFSQSMAAFGQYGWAIMSAYTAGACYYLKHRFG